MEKISSRLKGLGAAITPQNFFVVTALVFGLIFMLITPPFAAPDEPVHFFRAYQISEGNLSVDKIGSTYGGRLPQSVQQTTADTYDKAGLTFHPEVKYQTGNTLRAFAISNTDKKSVLDFSTTAYYSPVSYIPQATGIALGRVMNAPPITSFYLGRLCNLLAWVALFYLAIRMMPQKKWAVAFIGLLPMALFQAASLSSDVMAVGLLAVTFAFVLKLIAKKNRINTQQLAGLLGLFTLLALAKQIMFLFVGLVLLVPNKLFKSPRAAIISKLILMAAPIVLFAAWSLHVKDIPFSSAVGGIDPNGQERFILHHPYDYANALFNTYFYSWGDGIVKSFIGNFGWVDTPLAESIVMVGYIALFLLMTAATGQTKQWLTRNQKILLAAIGAAYLLGVSTALYAYSTPVGFKIVVGLVGRYYLPVALLLIPLLAGNWLRTSERAYRRIAIAAPLFLLICSTITIYVRYYINNV